MGQRIVACFTFLALLVPLAVLANNEPDYTQAGPCKYEKLTFSKQVMPSSSGCKLNQCLVKPSITLPSTAGHAAGCPAGPYPVIVFFNAFQTFSISYKDYAAKLASYGYAVVQYDTAPGALITDKKELPFTYHVLEFLKGKAAAADSKLQGRIDFDSMAVAGHSRGGKLAALQLAYNGTIKTAYLIDPVDNTIFSPESEHYPSARKALQAAQPQRIAAVMGGGVISLCNPADANYPGFYAALAKGSWLQVLPQAAHLAFARTPIELTAICGKGATTSKEAVPITATSCVAWMEHIIRAQPLPTPFKAFVEASVSKGVMTFTSS